MGFIMLQLEDKLRNSKQWIGARRCNFKFRGMVEDIADILQRKGAGIVQRVKACLPIF